MNDRDMCLKYVDMLDKRAEACNQRIRRSSVLFVVLAVVLHFLSGPEAATLELVGAEVTIPRHLIVAIAPLLLSMVYFALWSFAVLEELCYREMRRVWSALDLEGAVSRTWQMRLLEQPSYYTTSQVRQDLGVYGVVHRLFDVCFGICYCVVPFGVVIAFIRRGWVVVGSPWLLIPHTIAVLLLILSLADQSSGRFLNGAQINTDDGKS